MNNGPTTSSALPTTDWLSTSAGPGRLTLQNLQRLDPAASACKHASGYATSARGGAIELDGWRENYDDDDDDVEDSDICSVFSSAVSCTSAASSTQEDEDAPFAATDAWGVTVTVYASLEQAVLYSSLRAAEDRRRERPSPALESFVVEPPSVVDFSPAGDDEDEDGFFSMG